MSLEKTIELLIKKNNKKSITRILSLHRSTQERLPYYETFFKTLLTNIKPKTILDLGCGFNPFAYKLMNLKKYYLLWC